MSLTNQSVWPHFLPMSLCSIDRPFVRAICIFRSHKFHETFCRVIVAFRLWNDARQTERQRKKSVLSANAMKANERRDEENDAAASPVQYVGQTTIIVRRFLVYYTASN